VVVAQWWLWCGWCNAATKGIDVYNTNSWSRTSLILLSREQSGEGDIVKDAAGNILPSQRLSSGELLLLQGTFLRLQQTFLCRCGNCRKQQRGLKRMRTRSTMGSSMSRSMEPPVHFQPENHAIDNEFCQQGFSGGLTIIFFIG